MSWKYEVFQDANLVAVEVFDEMTDDDAVHAVDVYQDEAYVPGMNELFVYTKVTRMNVSNQAVREAARVHSTYDNALKGIRVALVGPQDLAYGLCRMYQILRQGAPYEIQVFREIEDALRFLDLDSVTTLLLAKRFT